MQKNKFFQVLQKKFKPLGCFFCELLDESNIFDFFRIIVENIVPLLNESKVYGPLHSKWQNEKDLHLKQQSILQKELTGKAKTSVEFLEKHLSLDDKELKEQISKLKNNLMPFTSEIPNWAISDLQTILNRAADNLKEKGVELTQANNNIIQHNEIYAMDKIALAWVAYEYLNLVRWCWNTPISFFDKEYKKAKSNNNYLEIEKLLGYKAFWEEINLIKNDPNSNSIFFFRKENFIKCIKLIIADIIINQEIGSKNTKFLIPYSIEYFFHENSLYIKVLWNKESTAEDIYEVHKCNVPNDAEIPYFAIQRHLKEISEKPAKTKIPIKKISQFLERTGLKGPLADVLFIIDTKYLMLRDKKIIISEIKDLSKAKLKNLSVQIKGFDKIPSIPTF